MCDGMIVKINKRINRKVGKTTYYKYGITIPNSVMIDLNWDDTTSVTISVKNKKIVISES